MAKGNKEKAELLSFAELDTYYFLLLIMDVQKLPANVAKLTYSLFKSCYVFQAKG